jgi:hypothetical protein
MKMALLGTTAALSLLAAIVFTSAASAQCRWAGYVWACRPGDHSPGSGYPQPGFFYGPQQYGAASHLGPEPGGGFYHMDTGNGNVGHTD